MRELAKSSSDHDEYMKQLLNLPVGIFSRGCKAQTQLLPDPFNNPGVRSHEAVSISPPKVHNRIIPIPGRQRRAICGRLRFDERHFIGT